MLTGTSFRPVTDFICPPACPSHPSFRNIIWLIEWLWLAMGDKSYKIMITVLDWLIFRCCFTDCLLDWSIAGFIGFHFLYIFFCFFLSGSVRIWTFLLDQDRKKTKIRIQPFSPKQWDIKFSSSFFSVLKSSGPRPHSPFPLDGAVSQHQYVYLILHPPITVCIR